MIILWPANIILNTTLHLTDMQWIYRYPSKSVSKNINQIFVQAFSANSSFFSLVIHLYWVISPFSVASRHGRGLILLGFPCMARILYIQFFLLRQLLWARLFSFIWSSTTQLQFLLKYIFRKYVVGNRPIKSKKLSFWKETGIFA